MNTNCALQHWNICHMCKWSALMCDFSAIWSGKWRNVFLHCLHAYLRRITVQDHVGKVTPRQDGEGGCQNCTVSLLSAEGWNRRCRCFVVCWKLTVNRRWKLMNCGQRLRKSCWRTKANIYNDLFSNAANAMNECVYQWDVRSIWLILNFIWIIWVWHLWLRQKKCWRNHQNQFRYLNLE